MKVTDLIGMLDRLRAAGYLEPTLSFGRWVMVDRGMGGGPTERRGDTEIRFRALINDGDGPQRVTHSILVLDEMDRRRDGLSALEAALGKMENELLRFRRGRG